MREAEGGTTIATMGDITPPHPRTRPPRTAIHYEGRDMTFGELDRSANQVANGLVAEGLKPQARIAILSKNAPAFFHLWFGGGKGDGVLAPGNFRLAPAEAAFV